MATVMCPGIGRIAVSQGWDEIQCITSNAFWTSKAATKAGMR